MIFTFSGNKIRPKSLSSSQPNIIVKENPKNINKTVSFTSEPVSTRDLFTFGMIGRVQTGSTCGHCSR
jgi:hypothetical protein